MRMLEPGGEADLAVKPLRAGDRPRLRSNDFEGYVAVVLQIAG